MNINDANLDTAYRGFKAVFKEAFDGATSHRDTLAMSVNSTTSEEAYGWLGDFPGMREWIGDRHVHQLASHGFSIRNKKFESTVTVKREDLADDRYGIYKPLFSEVGRTAKTHPDTMIFSLLGSGFETACFDGQNFFDAEHPQSQLPGDEQAEAVSNMQDGEETAWYLLDLSRSIRPIIWQEREGYAFQAVTNTNDYKVFMTDEIVYGVRARVNCGFGLWQLAYASKADLTPENYAAARAAMMAFTGDRGRLLGIMPTHLVVPPTLEAKARALINGDQDNGTSNIWRDSAELIITPYLA